MTGLDMACPRCGGWAFNFGTPDLRDCSLCNGMGQVTVAMVRAWLDEHPRGHGPHFDRLRALASDTAEVLGSDDIGAPHV